MSAVGNNHLMEKFMQYSLGPLLYCWKKNEVFDFYQNVAESQIPLVYLGEVVCSRRRELTNKDYLFLAHMLKESGKKVVLSTMALVENQSEITEMTKLINNGDFMIEANDMAAVHLAHEQKLPFVSGCEINHYNLASLKLLHQLGMVRFVMPVELSKQWLTDVIGDDKTQLGFEVEVTGYGYLPLALSARCFTARHLNLPKDKCETACKNYSKGIVAQTQDSHELLRLNGIQTQSATVINLQPFSSDMDAMGVDYFRVLPNSFESIDMVNKFMNKDNPQILSSSCNGYWLGDAGMNHYS